MNASLPAPVQALVAAFRTLPGVGPRTALRYAFAMMRASSAERTAFAESLTGLNRARLICATCGHVSGEDPCIFCRDPVRNIGVLCVVADPQDVLALEATGAFKGRYHVLGGVIRPLDGQRPEDLSITALLARIEQEKPSEIILALDPDMDGETTLLYLRRQLASLSLKVTRLARGLPVGSDLEYADETTLTDALNGRRDA